ncbi:MAG: phosphatidylglycerol lysyltransferase domain-containing protein [Propionibacteriaceae bacterium]|nr:phosphatidylglycerol lysyltransferase domain-containing protein [Propionibacteriaceae bacterium]
MAWCREHRVERVSLNFAALRHVFARAEDVAAAPVERMNSRVLSLLDRWWQLERLYRANAKYRVSWAPRYIALPSPLALPQVAVAGMVAEGFLPGVLARRAGGDANAVLPPPRRTGTCASHR